MNFRGRVCEPNLQSVSHWAQHDTLQKTIAFANKRKSLLVIQIQEELSRINLTTWNPYLVARRALRFKRGQRKCSCIGGQILPTRINNNHWKLIYVSRTIPSSQYETNLWSTRHVNIARLAEPIRRCVRWWRTRVFKIEGFCLQAFPSFPSPYFHILALVSFLARPKRRIPFLGLSLVRNQTETLATQANEMRTLWHNELVSSILFLWDKEVTQIIQKSPRTINTSLFGEGGGGKESVAILTALSKFARKTVLKINWSVKTPWLERMEFAPSGLWAPGQC